MRSGGDATAALGARRQSRRRDAGFEEWAASGYVGHGRQRRGFGGPLDNGDGWGMGLVLFSGEDATGWSGNLRMPETRWVLLVPGFALLVIMAGPGRWEQKTRGGA